jgi:hypothetical protein
MRFIALIVMSLSFMALTGCVVHSHGRPGGKVVTPSTKVVIPGAVVVAPNGGHCPPGQAKKGNC